MTHRLIPVAELRDVLAAALLALDDDVEPPELRVLLPDGSTRDVDGVVYFHDAASHFIELRVDEHQPLPNLGTVDSDRWVAEMFQYAARRRVQQPLNDVRGYARRSWLRGDDAPF